MDNGKRDLNNGQETAAQNPQQVLPQGTGQNTGYPGAVPPEPVRKKKKKTRFWGGFFTGMRSDSIFAPQRKEGFSCTI